MKYLFGERVYGICDRNVVPCTIQGDCNLGDNKDPHYLVVDDHKQQYIIEEKSIFQDENLCIEALSDRNITDYKAFVDNISEFPDFLAYLIAFKNKYTAIHDSIEDQALMDVASIYSGIDMRAYMKQYIEDQKT